LLALTLTGCGNSKPEAVLAGGKVMFNTTTPPVGALVVFHPVDPEFGKRIGGKPFGKVNDDGTFTLTTYTKGDGAPEGEYGVTVDWRGSHRTGKLNLGGEDSGEDRTGGGISKLKPKYGNPQQPFTRVIIKKGDANQFTCDVD
jgi:hypothetical protein